MGLKRDLGDALGYGECNAFVPNTVAWGQRSAAPGARLADEIFFNPQTDMVRRSRGAR
jgi:hypothetical protein